MRIVIYYLIFSYNEKCDNTIHSINKPIYGRMQARSFVTNEMEKV